MDKRDLQSFFALRGMVQSSQIEWHQQGPKDHPWMGDFCYERHGKVSNKKRKGYDNS